MEPGNYNPYDNRHVEAPLSNFDAFISLLKSVVGTGILAMPYSYKYGGLIAGTVMTFMSTFLIMYGMHLLIQCMVESSRQNKVGYMTYTDTMVYAFSMGPAWCRYCSKVFGNSVDIILCFCHYGVCVIYIVFVSVNFQQLSDHFIGHMDLRTFCAIVGLLCLPLFLIRHLKYLVPFNMLANVLIYLGIAFIFYYVFSGLPEIGDKTLFPNILDVPMFIAIVLFAVSSVGVMLVIESKMATPNNYLGWTGTLSLGGILVFITYALFGFFGYWRYGEIIQASITLNVPTDEILAQLIKLFMAVAVFLTYPLSGYVPIDIILNHYIIKNRELEHPHRIEYIIRIIFVILTTVNAVAFPNLGPLLTLVGAFSISILNLIFPCCIELCLLYHYSYGKLKWKLWKDILIIVFGTIILFYGTYNAIYNIMDEYGGSQLKSLLPVI